MQSMEKNVEKQMIIRTFEPNLDELKKTARQLAHMQDVSLNLYGQAGEVLIVVTARAFAQAAATELTESVAEQFELSLGAAVYGRGKGSLAYFTAGELIEHEANIAAADNATGALLAEEFGRTKRGPSVFDFGEGSYRDRRYLEKVRAAEERYADEDDLPQTAAARAVAAAKYGHADFGVAVLGAGSGEYVYAAVAHKGYVYLRRLRDGDTAGKSAALMSLELVRRLMKRLPVDNARMFKAAEKARREPVPHARHHFGGAAGGAGRCVLVLLHAFFYWRGRRVGRRAAREQRRGRQHSGAGATDAGGRRGYARRVAVRFAARRVDVRIDV